MAAEVCETPCPERAGEVAGRIAADAQQGRLAALQAHAATVCCGGASAGRRARILQLAEEALEHAARDLAVAKSALRSATGLLAQDARMRAGEAYDAAERCCDRLLLVGLLLERPTRVTVPGTDDDDEGDEGVRLRVAGALEKAMAMAEDCASLVPRARQGASGAPAT